jgi:hypothetical protein
MNLICCEKEDKHEWYNCTIISGCASILSFEFEKELFPDTPNPYIGRPVNIAFEYEIGTRLKIQFRMARDNEKAIYFFLCSPPNDIIIIDYQLIDSR